MAHAAARGLIRGFGKEKKKKLPMGISEEFIDEVDKLGIDGLRGRIVDYAKGIEEAQVFLKGNEQIQELKTAYDEAAAPTRDAIKALKNKTKHVLEVLQKAGG